MSTTLELIAALVTSIALTTPEVAVGWSRSLTRVCFPRRMTSSSSFSSHRSSSSPSSSGKDDDTSERITDDEELSNFESIENDDVDEGKRRQLYSYVSRLETVYDNDLIPYILGGQIELAELFPSSLDTTINDDDESTQREQGRQRRVILGDWLDRQEEVGVAAVCVGDSCGDDSEVSSFIIQNLPNIIWFHTFHS